MLSKNPALSTSNKVGRHLNDLQKVVLATARAVLLVYRTTPIAVLRRESSLLPTEIELDQLAILATVRIRRLDPYHPLSRRAAKITRLRVLTSRFARRILALPALEQVNPIQQAPWYSQESRTTTMDRIAGPCSRTKAQASDDFRPSSKPSHRTIYPSAQMAPNYLAGKLEAAT